MTLEQAEKILSKRRLKEKRKNSIISFTKKISTFWSVFNTIATLLLAVVSVYLAIKYGESEVEINKLSDLLVEEKELNKKFILFTEEQKRINKELFAQLGSQVDLLFGILRTNYLATEFQTSESITRLQANVHQMEDLWPRIYYERSILFRDSASLTFIEIERHIHILDSLVRSEENNPILILEGLNDEWRELAQATSAMTSTIASLNSLIANSDPKYKEHLISQRDPQVKEQLFFWLRNPFRLFEKPYTKFPVASYLIRMYNRREEPAFRSLK